jgi:hypothetical protein
MQVSGHEPSGWFFHRFDKEHETDHWRRVGNVENLGILVDSLGNFGGGP